MPQDPRFFRCTDDVFGFHMTAEELSHVLKDAGLPVKVAKIVDSSGGRVPAVGVNISPASAAAFLCELYPATCNKEREEWADWSPPFELPWPFRLPVPLFTSTLTLPKKDAILL
ncbi:hypothetical protein EAH_00012000 [Eimeria acervulina]|uniref:Uncharacterized protein n=1 Tax=Eimeria acervulina TaxID=5801 RepID=U6GHI0_EIMAC|nr:hypothetical protein EAH_00012000 [Eimeria acervulina]CDI79721.1 hypothetical protein EAH_00012000 [Eimeria acervulina]